jgi:hypothetical protein
MAKFVAGDMITGKLKMSDGTRELKCFMVNRVIEDGTYGPMYSLDNGDGRIDGRCSVAEIDKTFKKC